MSKYIDYTGVEFYRWRLDDIEQNEKQFVIGRYNQKDLTRKTHTHEFIQIYYILNGTIKHTIENEKGYVTKGDIFILPPDIFHLLENMDCKDVEFISIGFMPSFIGFTYDESTFLSKFLSYLLIQNTLKDQFDIKPKVTFSGELQLQVENLVTDLLDEYISKREGYLLYIEGQLLRLLVLIAREYVSTPYYSENKDKLAAYNIAISGSIKYINENFIKDIKIYDVAKHFQLSRTYFCELFKQYTNKTFNEYINDLRISQAKHLLLSTKSSITDIAYSSGFNDSSSFSRKFLKKTGTSPSEFRKML